MVANQIIHRYFTVQEISVTEESPPAATVAMFVYDERPAINLFRSMLRDIRGWPALEPWIQGKDALIVRSRGTIATRFLDGGAGDVLVMIDHDIGWDAGDLEHLVRTCLDTESVVGGIYPLRGFGLGAPVRGGTDLHIGKDGAAEVEYVGTGFMAIHRRVLERLSEHMTRTAHGFYNFFPLLIEAPVQGGEPELLSEDYSFCKLVRGAGFKVWADLKPTLTHFGSHEYRMVDTGVRLPESRTFMLRNVAYREAQPIHLLGRTARVYVDPEDRFVSGTILRGAEWEPEVSELLARLGAKGGATRQVLVDLGAHIGVHTVLAAPYYSEVLAVEALPHLAEILVRNVKLNELENVTVWSGALWTSNASPKMIRDVYNSGASHVSTTNQGIPVDRVDLQELTARLAGSGHVLKVDIEGAEPRTFMNDDGSDFLAKFDHLLFEYCPAQFLDISEVSGSDYLAFLREVGFRITRIDGAEFDDGMLPTGQAYINLLGTR